jgi:hypothetical protein
MMLLPQPPQCWGYRCVPLHMTSSYGFNHYFTLTMLFVLLISYCCCLLFYLICICFHVYVCLNLYVWIYIVHLVYIYSHVSFFLDLRSAIWVCSLFSWSLLNISNSCIEHLIVVTSQWRIRCNIPSSICNSSFKKTFGYFANFVWSLLILLIFSKSWLLVSLFSLFYISILLLFTLLFNYLLSSTCFCFFFYLPIVMLLIWDLSSFLI